MSSFVKSCISKYLTLWVVFVFTVLIVHSAVSIAVTPFFSPIASGFSGARLTSEGTDTYNLSGNMSRINHSAPLSNKGSNSRGVYWPSAQKKALDEQVCATWNSQNGSVVQQGVALRVKAQPNGRVRAITVTKNIYTGDPNISPNWVFNIHGWDAKKSGTTLTAIRQFNLKSTLQKDERQAVSFPWNICAKIVGQKLDFQVWPVGQQKPAWGNALYGGSVQIPTKWVYKGNYGWYVGHLQAGDNTVYSNLRTSAPTASLPSF